ncbi:MAG: GGDEF domain-containing protein [Acidimicrobiia bacterium]
MIWLNRWGFGVDTDCGQVRDGKVGVRARQQEDHVFGGSVSAAVKAWSRAVRTDWPTRAVTAIVAYVGVYLVWTFTHFAGDPTTVSDLAPIPVGIIATWLAWRASRARSLDVCTRRAWLLIAFGIAAWAVGDITWAFLEVVQNSTPFPSVADAGYLAFYPLAFAGLLVMPVPRRPSDRTTLWLDTATVMIGTLMAVWYLVIGPTLSSTSGDWLSEALSLAYPTGDLILVLGVARILLRRPGSGTARALLVLGGGILSTTIADVMYARLELSGAYSAGSFTDVLWIAALVLMGVAAYFQVRLGTGTATALDPTADAHPRASRLPYVAVALGFVLLLRETGLQRSEPLLILSVGALLTAVLVVFRQFAVMRENERLVGALDLAASIDSLTGLSNRRRFHEVGTRLLMRAAENGEAVSAVMIDVDHFKQINDKYGHAVGDAVLRWVGKRCSDLLRAGDLLARYGGDEFVVLLPGLHGDEARVIAERLGEAVADVPIPTELGEVSARLSLGVADNAATVSLDRLLSRADAALYEAKRAGRGRTAVAGGAPPPVIADEAELAEAAVSPR